MTPADRPVEAWTIIIPVKDTTAAKTRLRGFSQPLRARLALAFALDTATAALTCPMVHDVVVVTNDEAAGRALAEIGARLVVDDPDAGLNAALEHGTAVVRRDRPLTAVAALLGDLPALRPADLEMALAAGSLHERWFVTDADGRGTALLAAARGTALAPAFGPDSRDAHRRSGAVDLVSALRVGTDLQRLRRDVDTEEQLLAAVALGVGPFTLAALGELALTASPSA